MSGVLILAGGAVVSASAGAGFAGLQAEDEPTPIALVSEPPASPVDEGEVIVNPPLEEEELPDEIVLTEEDCLNEDDAHEEARKRIEVAFKEYDGGLDKLRARLGGKGSSAVYESVDSAKALLSEIRTSALEALDQVGLCNVQVASVGQVGFDARSGAAALIEVAESAVAAMETVYNLARSTVLQELERLKPTPTPKPKRTESPKETARPTKAPRCDDAMYAAKDRLKQAYTKYYEPHYRMLKELKGWASESSMKAFWAADGTMRQAYDRTRERIVAAACATGEHSAMALAETAEILFRETYATSRALYETLAEQKPDYEGCKDDMYAAKEIMYGAFERWHGANDKLINGLKSFASEDAIEAAKAADRTMHETFDRTKQKIVEAACSKEHEAHVMGLARGASETFQAAHQSALVRIANELARRGDDD